MKMLQPMRVVGAGLIFLGLAGCGGDNGNGGTQASRDRLNDLFPFSESEPLETVYACNRSGSGLLFVYDFLGNGMLQVRFADGANNDVTLPGTYSYQNGEITLDPVPSLTTFAERSLQTDILMGLIVHFTVYVDGAGSNLSPEMVCFAVGHHKHDLAESLYRHYTCPINNLQAVSDDQNALEFNPRSLVHGSGFIPGGIFRQRDRYVSGRVDPLVVRGYGVYRRSGDQYYAVFPADPFDDFNVISGGFQSNDTVVGIHELNLENCTLN